MSNYSEALVAKLEAQPKWTYASTAEFAEANGLKHRSVIAKVKSLGLEYEPKPARVTKRGEPVVLKAEMVAAVEKALAVSVPSLSKVTKEDLERLVEAVGAEMPEAR